MIKNLIVHHSVSAWGGGETIKHWHCDPKPRGNGWKHPGYHVVITNRYNTYNAYISRMRGQVKVDRILRETIPSNGCKYANDDSLQVCLIGDFDKQEPLAMQFEKLIDLLVHWCKKYKLVPNDIYGHGEMQRKIGKEKYSKTCPGKLMNMDAVRMAVALRLAGK